MFKSPNDFSLFIEKQAIKTKSNCSTVLIEYCENNDVDYDKVATLVNRQLKDKLAIEFAEMGMLRAQPSLEDM
jgi:GMP synthase PP-ATPase subunit